MNFIRAKFSLPLKWVSKTETKLLSLWLTLAFFIGQILGKYSSKILNVNVLS